MADAFNVLPLSLFEYLTAFFANDSFYVVVPYCSSHYRRIMSDASRHRRQCQARFGMNDAQFAIFSASRFEKLYQPVYAFWRDTCYPEYTHAANEYWLQRRHQYPNSEFDPHYTDDVTAAVSAVKDWCVECTNLHKHLRRLTISLCWNLPTNTSDGTAIIYELPSIFQQVYIDSITAKHVFPLLRGCY